MAKFPAEVWDGLTPARGNLASVSAPKHEDYVTLVDEIQAIETYLLAFAQNMQVMPNLQQVLEEARAKVAEVEAKIATVTAPDDLRLLLEGVTNKIIAVDARADVAALKLDLGLLRQSITEVQLLAEGLIAAVRDELQQLRNETRNAHSTIRKCHEEGQKTQTAENNRLNRLLNIKTEIDRLKGE